MMIVLGVISAWKWWQWYSFTEEVAERPPSLTDVENQQLTSRYQLFDQLIMLTICSTSVGLKISFKEALPCLEPCRSNPGSLHPERSCDSGCCRLEPTADQRVHCPAHRPRSTALDCLQPFIDFHRHSLMPLIHIPIRKNHLCFWICFDQFGTKASDGKVAANGLSPLINALNIGQAFETPRKYLALAYDLVKFLSSEWLSNAIIYFAKLRRCVPDIEAL
ncbi:unnamed protein product [Aspergillus oryzae var. brunneus]|uniref:Unnamed protein product n=1 Tax=Aspergillus oryzae var. brunneus TaxID=332754 RepID=A0ABQ6KZE8_ASPOZ|nr:unnamed protein product [Aspergillus oryzae var. brunneus]